MPHLNIPFYVGSPIIDLYVGVSQQRRSALLAAGQSIPDFQRARALIDTGASGTCIDPPILKPLGLTATGIIAIHTPSTSGKPVQFEQFDVSLGIAHPTRDPMIMLTVPVIATTLVSQGISALIGRDVLSSCLFVYDGNAESFILAF